MKRAKVENGGLRVASHAAYNVGGGDFTFTAMFESMEPGPIARRYDPNVGGITIELGNRGEIKFSIAGAGVAPDGGDVGIFDLTYSTTSEGLFDNRCHTVSIVRSGIDITIYIDGTPTPLIAPGQCFYPIDIDNNAPFTFGYLGTSGGPKLSGFLMNIGFWNRAIAGHDLVRASFANITRDEPGLCGYWMLDGSAEDMSNYHNSAVIDGSVTFADCMECKWNLGVNAYSFATMGNTDSDSDGAPKTQRIGFIVPNGARGLIMSLIADADIFAFSTDAFASLIDPSGTRYEHSRSDDKAFVHAPHGYPVAVSIVSPQPGRWDVAVTAQASAKFRLVIHTVPTGDLVNTCRLALPPICESQVPQAARIQKFSMTSGWSLVAYAVMAAVGVAVAAGVAVTAPVTAPFAAVGAGALAVFSIASNLLNAPKADPLTITEATTKVASAAGFDKLVRVLLMDAAVAEDLPTQIIYQQRQSLYSLAEGGSFKGSVQKIVDMNMTRSNVRAALPHLRSAFISAGSHGEYYSLKGWYDKGVTVKISEEDVLSTFGDATFPPQYIKGHIIHFFACKCGIEIKDNRAGLGKAMVDAGALAFFGYREPFGMYSAQAKNLCGPDMVIDAAILSGKTCGEAFDLANKEYDKLIALYDRLRQSKKEKPGSTDFTLEQLNNYLSAATNNKSFLVFYGDRNAKLTL